jgi:hypothetical protein
MNNYKMMPEKKQQPTTLDITRDGGGGGRRMEGVKRRMGRGEELKGNLFLFIYFILSCSSREFVRGCCAFFGLEFWVCVTMPMAWHGMA